MCIFQVLFNIYIIRNSFKLIWKLKPQENDISFSLLTIKMHFFHLKSLYSKNKPKAS